VVGFLAGIPTASAVAFTGSFSPTIISGGADLNGDGVVNGRDDSNAFFGDTSIIDGHLDCDAWGVTKNAGIAGSGTITVADDCTLVGYDGTADGVTITVTDGVFGWTTGTALPTVYNATNPDSPGVFVADFAWSTIGGKVDSNGNETIGGNDCTFGLIGQTVDVGLGDATDGADILGSDAGCGFAGGPLSSTLNGLVDLNSDVRSRRPTPAPTGASSATTSRAASSRVGGRHPRSPRSPRPRVRSGPRSRSPGRT